MGHGQCILIIDDDLDIRLLLRSLMRHAGYEAIVAPGGLEGLSVLHETQIDLILLDLMMPGMTGWRVLENIRADEQLRIIPVIIMSARAKFAESEQLEAHAGMYNGYVAKPFSLDDLLAQVAQAFR